MKITSITPEKYAKFILEETRRYCGKCGKLFDLIDSKKDNVRRCYSPCCNNMINNETICKYHSEGLCPIGTRNNCGSKCTQYKPNN
jgi:hypothetical protein